MTKQLTENQKQAKEYLEENGYSPLLDLTNETEVIHERIGKQLVDVVKYHADKKPMSNDFTEEKRKEWYKSAMSDVHHINSLLSMVSQEIAKMKAGAK
ncbi:hypothetical protein [Sporosarcina sp. P17b]|uniref:hypothetical protein n=1 Tax=Sporosarcina sp. P17b TaxID=2048260 RepID=UPI000C16B285|nr:hypothetical protein [Sporosarcina sp. P17b]PIC75044.1 hypothetical protein CSV76_00080 [Sporosarcina sp. P17b]